MKRSEGQSIKSSAFGLSNRNLNVVSPFVSPIDLDRLSDSNFQNRNTFDRIIFSQDSRRSEIEEDKAGSDEFQIIRETSKIERRLFVREPVYSQFHKREFESNLRRESDLGI